MCSATASLPGSNVLNLHRKFLIVDKLQFDIIIGAPTLKDCRANIDFENSLVTFNHNSDCKISFLQNNSDKLNCSLISDVKAILRMNRIYVYNLF